MAAENPEDLAVDLEKWFLDMASLQDCEALWADMRRDGMSYRQIAEADGTVSHDTVQKSIVRNRTVDQPETITGKDGKERAARKPKHITTMFAPDADGEKDLLLSAKEIRKKDAAARKESRKARNEKLAEETYALTGEKRYRVIYADPPWSYGDKRDDAERWQRRAPRACCCSHAATLSVIPFAKFAHLRLNRFTPSHGLLPVLVSLPAAFGVYRAWGVSRSAVASALIRPDTSPCARTSRM